MSALQASGFSVWYDADIEVGTDWPENVAKHLADSSVVLAFLSKNFISSQNCIREVNFAVAENKETVVVHLEEVELSAGMRMQLGTSQALLGYKLQDEESIVLEIEKSVLRLRGDLRKTTN